MVFDHSGRQVFASLSPRTDAELVKQFATEIGYQPIIFDAVDRSGKSIYHTNVMMAIGTKWAAVCFESIPHEAERKKVRQALESSAHEVFDLSFVHLENFAGNMLELENSQGEVFIAMSQIAKQSLNKTLLAKLETHGKILAPDITTIETIGGGSVRCMLAEIFCAQN